MGGESGGAVISDGLVATTAVENEERCKQTSGVEHAVCELEHHSQTVVVLAAEDPAPTFLSGWSAGTFPSLRVYATVNRPAS